jgi:hypothetical protein
MRGTVAPEQTGFELERFQWSDPDRLEVEGRWFGVRGRRFVRPVLTVQVAGRRRRLLALLEHKPWNADEGETWIAAFPWDGSHDDVGDGELEVGALTVDLPPPGGAKRAHKRRKAETEASLATVAGAKPKFGTSKDAEPEAVAPPEPREEPALRAAGETRQQLERDLAGARAELGRLRARHEEEVRELRSKTRNAAERLEALESKASADARRAEALTDEAGRLREELRRVREGQGDELSRMGASEADARAELERERERAGAVAGEAERLRAAQAEIAAEAGHLAAERHGAEAEIAKLREAHEEAVAEIGRLRQAVRRSAGETERLRAASRRPGGRLPEPPPARAADPQETVPFQAVPEAGEEPRTAPTVPSKPGPAVRRIPREKPAPEQEPPAPEAAAPPPEQEPPAPEPAAEAAPDRPQPRQAAQAPRMRPEPGAGAARLLGEHAIVPLEQRGALAVWGPRLVAIVLVALLLIALALIVRGIL